MDDKRSKKLYKTGNDVIDYASEISKIEKEYYGKDNILGITSLTFPSYMSSNRAILLANHLKQFKTLKNKEIPILRTNYEDIVGKHGSYLHKAKSDCVVEAKIDKFEFAPNLVYYLILYSEEEDKYYLEIKKHGVETQERFGIHINNENMDKLTPGDKIPKGYTLWKSSSYDEDDLYGFGINARCTWMIDNWTIDDAVKIRKGFAKKCTTYEDETVEVTLNDNDILVNLYGDNSSYKGFPEVGTLLNKNMVCATFKKKNDQILYDMQESKLREVSPLDNKIYYAKCEHNAIVWDIDLYCNQDIDSIPDNYYNNQIIRYLENQKRFYTEVYNTLHSIIHSGSKYDDDIGFWYRRSKCMIDPDVSFRKDDSIPNYLHIKFKIEREVEIDIGNKITGRYGNKGVVSIIVDDDKMPYTIEDGEKVPLDIVFNTLGIPNRLITMPLFEVEFTGAADKVRRLLNKIPKLKDKEKLLFHFISFFDDCNLYTQLKDYYRKLSFEGKKDFFEDIRKYGIFIHIPPMWEKEKLYDRLKRLYHEIPECNPRTDVYIRKFDREIKMLNPLVVGYMYVLILKQTSKKGFSARSLGYVNIKGLPDKTSRLRNNLDVYSKTPIKNGIDDCNNMNIGMLSEDIAKFHFLYRNSVMARREWKKLLTDNVLDFEDLELKHEYTNRNVEILNALLMCRGQGIVFPGDNIYIHQETDSIEEYIYKHKQYICDEKTMREIIINDYFKDKWNEKIVIGPKEFVEDLHKKFNKHQMNKLRKDITYVYMKDDLIYD